jgi:hypothetical protein
MLLALAAPAQIHDKPAKKTIFIDIDEFESHSVSEGAKLATAIVRVRTISSRFVTATSSNGDVRPSTEHRCEILDIYKDDPAHPLRVGEEIPILQNAGVYETPEVRYVIGDDATFQSGDELVLFLSWNRAFLAHEAWKQLQFRVTGHRIEPLHESIHEEEFRELTLQRLVNEVRGRSHRQ